MAKKILRGFRFADIPIWIKNAFLTILKGRLLITLKIERYFVHIIYTFFLFWVSIYLGMKIEDIPCPQAGRAHPPPEDEHRTGNAGSTGIFGRYPGKTGREDKMTG